MSSQAHSSGTSSSSTSSTAGPGAQDGRGSRSPLNETRYGEEWITRYKEIPRDPSLALSIMAYATGANRKSTIVKKKTSRRQAEAEAEHCSQLFWVGRRGGRSEQRPPVFPTPQQPKSVDEEQADDDYDAAAAGGPYDTGPYPPYASGAHGAPGSQHQGGPGPLGGGSAPPGSVPPQQPPSHG